MATRDQVYIDIITETKKSISGLKNLVMSLGAAYAAFKTVQQIAKVALDATMYAAKIDQISRAFDAMASAVGQDAESVITNMDRLAGGTINKLDLLTSASRAALFKLPIDKMDELMQIARASATATGESVKYMFDSIVLGIARGSPKILDNLGILIDATKANKDYAESIGKAADELTAAEQTQATMNAVLKAGREIMEGVGKVGQEITDAERWQILQSAVADLKGEIGEGLLPAYRALTEQATEVVKQMTEMVRLSAAFKKQREGVSDLKDELLILDSQIKQTKQTLLTPGLNEQWTKQINETLTALEAQRNALARTIGAIEEKEARQRGAVQTAKKLVAEELRAEEELIQKRKEILDSFKQLDSVIEPVIDEIVHGFQESTMAALGLTDQVSLFYDKLKLVDPVVDETMESIKEAVIAMDDYGRVIEMATINLDNFAGMEERVKGLIETTTAAIEDNGEALTELTEKQEKMAAIATGAFVAFGQAFADTAVEGGEIFKEAMKAGVASAVQALAMLAMAEAGIAVAQLNFVKAAALFGAGTLAFAAAAGIRALGEGGIVTKPTLALVGEKGPEEWRPLSKARAMSPSIVVHNHIQGSLITEDELMRRTSGYIAAAFSKGY